MNRQDEEIVQDPVIQASFSAKRLCAAQCFLVFLPALFLFLISSPMQEFWYLSSRSPQETMFLTISFTLPYVTLAVAYVLLYVVRRMVLKEAGTRFRLPWWFYLCHLAGIGLFVCGALFLPAL